MQLRKSEMRQARGKHHHAVLPVNSALPTWQANVPLAVARGNPLFLPPGRKSTCKAHCLNFLFNCFESQTTAVDVAQILMAMFQIYANQPMFDDQDYPWSSSLTHVQNQDVIVPRVMLKVHRLVTQGHCPLPNCRPSPEGLNLALGLLPNHGPLSTEFDFILESVNSGFQTVWPPVIIIIFLNKLPMTPQFVHWV